MVLQWQDLFYKNRYSHTRMTNPNFVALAKAMGVHAIRAEKIEELPAKMKEFMEYDNTKPILLECRVHTNEHVSMHFLFVYGQDTRGDKLELM